MAYRRHSTKAWATIVGRELAAESKLLQKQTTTTRKRPKKASLLARVQVKLHQVKENISEELLAVDDHVQRKENEESKQLESRAHSLLDAQLPSSVDGKDTKSLGLLHNWEFGFGSLTNQAFTSVLERTSGSLKNLVLLEQLLLVNDKMEDTGLSETALIALQQAARTLIKFTVFDCDQVGLWLRASLHSVIANLDNVRELSLGNIPNVWALDFGLFVPPQAMPKLDTIRLFFAPDPPANNDHGAASLISFQRRQLYKWISAVAERLEVLEVAYFPGLAPGQVIEALRSKGAGAPKLQTLKLLETGALLVDQDLAVLGEVCPNLRTLAVTHANLAQDSVVALFKACPQLLHVHLNKQASELNPLLSDIVRPRLVARAQEQRGEAETRLAAADADLESLATDVPEREFFVQMRNSARKALDEIPSDKQLNEWDISRLVTHVLRTERLGMGWQERTGVPQSLGVFEEMHARDAWAAFRED